MRAHVFTRILLLTAMLLVAFGLGERYSTSTSAQSLQKWEYQVIKADKIENGGTGNFEIKGLRKLGEDGWEVAAMNDSWVLLKRGR